MIFVSDDCFKAASYSLTFGQLYLYRLEAMRASRTQLFYN